MTLCSLSGEVVLTGAAYSSRSPLPLPAFVMFVTSDCICFKEEETQLVKSVWAHAASCFSELVLLCALEIAHEFTSLTLTAPLIPRDSLLLSLPLIHLILPLLISYFCIHCSSTLSLAVLPLLLLHLPSFPHTAHILVILSHASSVQVSLKQLLLRS